MPSPGAAIARSVDVLLSGLSVLGSQLGSLTRTVEATSGIMQLIRRRALFKSEREDVLCSTLENLICELGDKGTVTVCIHAGIRGVFVSLHHAGRGDAKEISTEMLASFRLSGAADLERRMISSLDGLINHD